MRTKNKDKELNHRHFIGLRLTDVELDLLDQGAACLSISRSEYLRKLLLATFLSLPLNSFPAIGHHLLAQLFFLYSFSSWRPIIGIPG